MKGMVRFEGKDYGPGGVLREVLGPYESFQIQEKFDLSGSHLLADRPVSMLGGNVDAQIGEGSFVDNMLSEFTPVHTWGMTFATAPVPDDQLGGYVKVVAKEPNTELLVNGELQEVIESQGGHKVIEVAANRSMYIRASKPIMAVYITKGDTSGAGLAYPASLLLPPLLQYLTDYPFTTFSDAHNAYQHHLLVVIRGHHLQGLTLDDLQVTLEGWEAIPGSGDLVSRALFVMGGRHRIRHLQDKPFAAYVYGVATKDCAYAFPAGMNLLDLTKVRMGECPFVKYTHQVAALMSYIID